MSKPKQQTAKAAEAAADLSFESALAELEGTVAQLEEGEMPLEKALELFETGVKLSRQCSTTLDAAERRIEILLADRGDELVSEPFADTSDASDAADADEWDPEAADASDRSEDDF